jgi:hypothetical protein
MHLTRTPQKICKQKNRGCFQGAYSIAMAMAPRRPAPTRFCLLATAAPVKALTLGVVDDGMMDML